MSISLIHGCSITSWLKRTMMLRRAGDIDRLAPADALEGFEDLGLLHQPPGERGVQRRQAQGAILEHFDELAAEAEEQHRAELRIEAAADDELVGVASSIMGWTVTPWKCSAPAFARDGFADVVEGVARPLRRSRDSASRRRRRSCG